MKRSHVSSFAAGLICSMGLCLSGMTDPGKVLGFLDLFGRWNPALAFVMVGAVGVHAVLYRLILRRQKPVFGDKFVLPTKKNLDVALIAGSALFGVGWGLVGYCPGPVVASLPAGALPTATFAGAMVVGFILYNRFEPAAARPNASRPPAPSQAAAKESLS